MAGLDPAIFVPVTVAGKTGNRVDARVKPAGDDFRVLAGMTRLELGLIRAEPVKALALLLALGETG